MWVDLRKCPVGQELIMVERLWLVPGEKLKLSFMIGHFRSKGYCRVNRIPGSRKIAPGSSGSAVAGALITAGLIMFPLLIPNLSVKDTG